MIMTVKRPKLKIAKVTHRSWKILLTFYSELHNYTQNENVALALGTGSLLKVTLKVFDSRILEVVG